MTNNGPVTIEDMKLIPPESLRDIVRQELYDANYDAWERGEKDKVRRYDQITDEEVKGILERVYEHIEKSACATYHTNAPWAIREWALQHILQDEIETDVTVTIAGNLVAPVVEWQHQTFDPITYVREILEDEGLLPKTIQLYLLVAVKFVGQVGRKREYTKEDILKYIHWARQRYKHPNSFYQELTRLLQFLRRLPDADRNMTLPIKMPKPADELPQPTFSAKDIDRLIFACVLFDVPSDLVARLLVSTVWGPRVSELAKLSSTDIKIDGINSTITIHTAKRGKKRPQPIPESLIPILNVPIMSTTQCELQRRLQRICKQMCIDLPRGAGYHAIRRSVDTILLKTGVPIESVIKFMRWSTPRQFAMPIRYCQTPLEETDREVLERHPYVKLWEENLPYFYKYHKEYSQLSLLNDNMQ